MDIVNAFWNPSDWISSFWTAPDRNHVKLPTDPAEPPPYSRLAATGREFTRDSENLMRFFKACEPALMALAAVGWYKQGKEAAFLIEGTRKVITTLVRPYKAADTIVNGKGEVDEVKYGLEYWMRQWVAPLSYGSLAIAGGIALANKRGLMTPLTGLSKSGLDNFLTYCGAGGNMIAGFGAGSAWYCGCQRVKGEQQTETVTGAKDLSKLKERRFWDACNALRYTSEGIFGIAAIYGGAYTGWGKIGAKALPASIGLYQTVIRSWMRTA